MRTNAESISYQIIQSQMRNIAFDMKTLHVDKKLKYGIYDLNYKPIYTQIKEQIDFSKRVFESKDAIFYIDHSASGHLGVSYVVIKKGDLSTKNSKLLIMIALVTLLLYAALLIIGFYLAKLFIKPIQNQREALNRFVKNATHELNTPISALLLCADSKNFYNKTNRNLIKISAKKISNIYKDLSYITLKKPNSSQQEKIDISKILLQEIPFYASIANRKKINLIYDIDETFFNIEAEDFIILCNNLISNAIKYTSRGGEITIWLKDNKLTIKDNGEGIKKEELKKIFQRYHRASSKQGGFGIGLDIVQSICNKYNIKIILNSKEGVGSQFILVF